MYIHTHVSKYVCNTYTHTYTYIHRYIYTHTQDTIDIHASQFLRFPQNPQCRPLDFQKIPNIFAPNHRVLTLCLSLPQPHSPTSQLPTRVRELARKKKTIGGSLSGSRGLSQNIRGEGRNKCQRKLSMEKSVCADSLFFIFKQKNQFAPTVYFLFYFKKKTVGAN